MKLEVHPQDDNLNEKCAVFGVYGAEKDGTEQDAASFLAFDALLAMQHRGHDASGIVTADGTILHRHAGMGSVMSVFCREDLEQLPGTVAIGHNRYATSGGIDGEHNQPIVDNDANFAFGHNGNLPNTVALRQYLEEQGVDCRRLNDSAMMAKAIGSSMLAGRKLPDAIGDVYHLFNGAFSAVAMDTEQVVAFRDRCGIRPLSIGRLASGAYVVASETGAFDRMNAEYTGDVEPGTMAIFDANGKHVRQLTEYVDPKLDAFEYEYFAAPESNLLGRNVGLVREAFGRQLAQEHPRDADIVVGVPESAIEAAIGYAEASGLLFKRGLVKNHAIPRTFITPTQEGRERALRRKLSPNAAVLAGKRVVLVDDSIVRGTTLKRIVGLVRSAGATEVHVVSSSPPILYPDFYGINTPQRDELVAAGADSDDIDVITKHVCAEVGADSLGFLSLQGMVDAIGVPADRLSMSCFTGEYPISIDPDVLEPAMKQRGMAPAK